MNPRDKISKTSWTLLESIKDVMTTNITNACREGQLKIEASQVQKLLVVIAASADEGYHRAHRAFMKGVDASLSEATLEPLSPKSSKKK